MDSNHLSNLQSSSCAADRFFPAPELRKKTTKKENTFYLFNHECKEGGRDGLWKISLWDSKSQRSCCAAEFPGAAAGQQNFRYRAVLYNAVLEGGIPLHEAYIQLTYSLHG